MNEIAKKYELWEPVSVYGDVWWRDKVFLENILRERPVAWLPSGFGSYDDLLLASADQAVRRTGKAHGTARFRHMELGPPASS